MQGVVSLGAFPDCFCDISCNVLWASRECAQGEGMQPQPGRPDSRALPHTPGTPAEDQPRLSQGFPSGWTLQGPTYPGRPAWGRQKQTHSCAALSTMR